MAGDILVVDDDIEVRSALADVFQMHGYTVELAANGADAIDLLERGHRPDVVLVDLLMPGVIGHSLLEYMRGDQQLSQIPVAIVSASPHLAPPGYRVFGKPVQLGALLEFVRRA
jgi:CheY-like chemotaxis protein